MNPKTKDYKKKTPMAQKIMDTKKPRNTVHVISQTQEIFSH